MSSSIRCENIQGSLRMTNKGIGQRDTVLFPFVPVLVVAAGLEGNSVTENQTQTDSAYK